jgi:predicted Na+-dependent transporter
LLVIDRLNLLHYFVLQLGVSTLVPLISTVIQLGSTVLLPLLFGQFARRVAGNWPQQKAHVLGFFSQFALLLVIYSTFCDTFANDAGHMDASDVLFAFLFGMQII